MRVIKKAVTGEKIFVPWANEAYPSPSWTGQFKWTDANVVKAYVSTTGKQCAKVQYIHPVTKQVINKAFTVNWLRR
jgi:hypothetical protein